VRTLFHELSRRRVFRVAGIYGVVAWVLTEVADVVFPALQLPDWTVTFVVALLILGFPIAMIFAWVFDIGPQGIERTEPLAERAKGIPHPERLVYVALVVVAMGIMAWFLYPRVTDTAQRADGPRDSIAVLPFSNLSQDSNNDYFSDGMSEELLNLLARVPNLRVASRTSSFAYKDQNIDVREVARQLGVDTVLEGSVRRQGDRVRITAQLIDARDGYHLWSQTYDRELKDIFAVQDEISAEIVKALKVTLAGDGEGDEEAPEPVLARAAPTDNVEAYQYYLQARHQFKRRGEEAINKTISLLEQALELDPEFARAYAGLAAAYVVLPGYVGEAPGRYFEEASVAARQALARDPNLGEAHAVLAQIDNGRWNWTDAEAGFFFATSLDPNDPTAHHWHSILLRNAGRLEASLEAAKKAFELDPASPIINNNLALVYVSLGYDEQALKYSRSAQELGLANVGGAVEQITTARRGDRDELLKFLNENPNNANFPPGFFEMMLDVAEDPSRIGELDAVLEQEDFPLPEAARFQLYTYIGQPEKALEIAMRFVGPGQPAVDLGTIWMPEGAAMRRLPGFPALMEKVGLVDYWKQYGWPDDCRPVGESFQCGFTNLVSAR
jgi:TolB-like protein